MECNTPVLTKMNLNIILKVTGSEGNSSIMTSQKYFIGNRVPMSPIALNKIT